MNSLSLKRGRMVSEPNGIPYIFELQAYYNSKKKTYSFPICGDIVRRIPDVQLSTEIRWAFKAQSTLQADLAAAKEEALWFPDDRLEDYQKSGAAWLALIKKGILADDQGSGKTVTSLAAAKYIDPGSVLVICSKNKRQEWCEEIAKWTGSSSEIHTKGTVDDGWTGYIVTNYRKAQDDRVAMTHADLVIVDEAHIMRNRKTGVFKDIRYICRKAEYAFILTASPSVNEISDFWTLLCICDEKRFGSYWGFAFRFCDIIVEIGITVGNVREDEVDNLRRMMSVYMLSREGNTALPDPEWVRVDYRLGAVQRKLYTQMEDSMEAEYNFQQCLATTPLSQITRQRQLALDPSLIFSGYNCGSKLDEVERWVKGWGAQTLLFAQYAELVVSAARHLTNLCSIPSTFLTNKLTDTRKEANRIAFKKGEFQVLAMTYKMGGEGLNLQEASQIIFLEYAWNPASMRHAYKRVLRRGQKSDQIRFVIIHAVDTIEDHILDIVREKRKVTVEEIVRRQEALPRSQF